MSALHSQRHQDLGWSPSRCSNHPASAKTIPSQEVPSHPRTRAVGPGPEHQGLLRISAENRLPPPSGCPCPDAPQPSPRGCSEPGGAALCRQQCSQEQQSVFSYLRTHARAQINRPRRRPAASLIRKTGPRREGETETWPAGALGEGARHLPEMMKRRREPHS